MEKASSHCGGMVQDSCPCVTCNKSALVSHGFKLFGVHFGTSEENVSAMKKTCCVKWISPSSSLSSCTLSNVSIPEDPSKFSTGSLPNSLNRYQQNRKKGVSWTEDEHRKFLAGLAKLGKGDWKGISKHFVQSRTPTQVASHAQKYFLKQNILNKKREMPRLFTMQTKNNGKGYLKAPKNTHGHPSDISKALWLKYAKQYYSDLLVSSWLYNSNGLATYPKCNYSLKSVETGPNLELALAVEAPIHDIQKHDGFLRT